MAIAEKCGTGILLGNDTERPICCFQRPTTRAVGRQPVTSTAACQTTVSKPSLQPCQALPASSVRCGSCPEELKLVEGGPELHDHFL